MSIGGFTSSSSHMDVIWFLNLWRCLCVAHVWFSFHTWLCFILCFDLLLLSFFFLTLKPNVYNQNQCFKFKPKKSILSRATNLWFSLVLQGSGSVVFIVLHWFHMEATCPGNAAINSIIIRSEFGKMSETLQLVIVVSQITLNSFELFSPIWANYLKKLRWDHLLLLQPFKPIKYRQVHG